MENWHYTVKTASRIIEDSAYQESDTPYAVCYETSVYSQDF